MILLREEKLEEIILQYDIVIVQFGNNTCAPCQDIRNKLERYEINAPRVICVYVDIDSHLTLCAREGIFTAPTVSVYVRGRSTIRESGYFSLDILLDKVERYIELLDEDE